MAHGQGEVVEAIAFLAAAAELDGGPFRRSERVLACTNVAELDRRIRRAAVGSQARQIFESTSPCANRASSRDVHLAGDLDAT